MNFYNILYYLSSIIAVSISSSMPQMDEVKISAMEITEWLLPALNFIIPLTCICIRS